MTTSLFLLTQTPQGLDTSPIFIYYQNFRISKYIKYLCMKTLLPSSCPSKQNDKPVMEEIQMRFKLFKVRRKEEKNRCELHDLHA